eukprot:CAMPEP_0185780498 /NCGR_PEP_ID=MMETSP1174-20130828/99293_1 /TAXON_ID=35687 /ORGANISM="Dictyocha speculum, Strain CCMP1381" /LENGTH=56 /DNA_ID=CAMNT_0028470093 /DNA_START=374 /DNA_END=544 /DNA_ORIENTATION=+
MAHHPTEHAGEAAKNLTHDLAVSNVWDSVTFYDGLVEDEAEKKHDSSEYCIFLLCL